MNVENGYLARPLDLDAVQAFVLVADLNSFTRAAEALETTQSAVSLKLKRLEDRLGRRLLERTPRKVGLSPEGAEFLVAARELLDAHERALNGHVPARLSLRLGISDQAAGMELPGMLAKVGAYDRSLRIEVRIGPSHHLLSAYDRGEIDVAIVCRDSARTDGEPLFAEPYGWCAVPHWEQRPDEPLRIASLTAPCTVRAMALKTLDDAGIAWTEVFVGGGLPAVVAAASAGLAVAPLPRRVCPPTITDVSERLGLPKLPLTEVMLYNRIVEPRTREAVRILVAALRAMASG
ncbi:LysR family transcriptional regulator [Dyella caseinilytica]|uniref:LysR family transcriptional regulator n=1 Tax=Dyella caseinilytica TaxID=1849581 RepID=A0ABX7GS19_9GAMM|nr:LysR family transcriptional regulator [Dyella caseinilytica]QRN52846.1 LysR family transcriptional regulator [Dyella caseinilytica]GGA09218.1 LysR family transcriptional regulator [Dyella caseinilytica]